MRTNGRAAERLNEVQAQLRDLREQRGAAAKARDCAVEVLPVGPGGDVNTKSPEFIAADAARQRVLALDSQIEMLRGAERDLLELMSGNGGPALAYSFLADPEKMQTLENVAKGSTRLPSLEQGGLALGQYMSADEMAATIGTALLGPVSVMGRAASGFDDTAAPSLGEGVRRGIVPQLRTPLRFLDLIPAVPADGMSSDYIQELGNLDTARETAEGTVKPLAEATYEDATAEHKTVAHFVKLPRQKLADSAELETRLRDRLTYGVRNRLERQVIAGDGAGANIQGILNTTGIGSVAFDVAELDATRSWRASRTCCSQGRCRTSSACPCATGSRS
jgi:hypothetical protein